MRLIGKFRFSIGALMMFVLMVAAGTALYVKALDYDVLNALDVHVHPTEYLLAIVLTTAALGAWKNHTVTQFMIQTTLACLISLSGYWSLETKHERSMLYWYLAMFALTITLPMLVRRHVKSAWPRGPRRDSWRKTCEAVMFSFLTFLIVTVGCLFMILDYLPIGPPISPPPGAGVPAPLLANPALLVPPPTLAPSTAPESP